MGYEHLADAALAFTALEAAWLGWRHRQGKRVPPPSDWALNLLSGALLMLALRVALGGGAWALWAAALSAAGVAHAADLVLRWKRVRPS